MPDVWAGCIDDGVLGGNGDAAAVGHGVAGIDGEIEQHLVELGGVAHDRPEDLGDIGLELNRSCGRFR